MLRCPSCNATINADRFNRNEPVPCSRCSKRMRVLAFPALYAETDGDIPPAIADAAGESEAGCYDHANRKATAVCDDCGRFLCALCKLEIDGRTTCPRCLAAARNSEASIRLVDQRPLLDNMALAFAVYPALLIFPSLIFAPLSLFIVFRYWKRPGGLLRNTKMRYVLAGILALIQLVIWVSFFMDDSFYLRA